MHKPFSGSQGGCDVGGLWVNAHGLGQNFATHDLKQVSFMSKKILGFIGACALFWSVVSQAIPQTQRDVIVQAVINELGRYDAAEIERRVRSWELDQPIPQSSGKVEIQAACGRSCPAASGGDNNYPIPFNVSVGAYFMNKNSISDIENTSQMHQ